MVERLGGSNRQGAFSEVNVSTQDVTRLCVDSTEGGGTDKSWTVKFSNVSNATPLTIRTYSELGGGRNALKEIRVYVRIHPTKTAADYEDAFFVISSFRNNVYTELGRFSHANTGSLSYSSNNYFIGDLTITAHNLPVSGAETLYIDVTWKNLP